MKLLRLKRYRKKSNKKRYRNNKTSICKKYSDAVTGVKL